MGFAQPQCDVRTFEEVDGARATASPSPPPPPSDVDGTVAWLRGVVGGDGALADAVETRARAEEIDGAVLTSMSEDEIGEVLAIDDALDSVADEAALLRVIARVRVVGALAAAAAKEPEIAPSSPAPPSASALAEWLRATRLRFMHDGDGENDDDVYGRGHEHCLWRNRRHDAGVTDSRFTHDGSRRPGRREQHRRANVAILWTTWQQPSGVPTAWAVQ